MRLIPKSLKWRTLLLTAWALAVVFGTIWYFHGGDIKRYVNRHRENYRLRDHDDPVIRGLARGEIGPGASIDEFIATHKPKRVLRHGRFVEVGHQSVVLVAMDGKLISAYYGGHIFFYQLSEADELAHLASRSNFFEQERQAWRDRHAAVAGFGFLPSNLGIKSPPDTGFHIRSPGPRWRDLSRPARAGRGAVGR